MVFVLLRFVLLIIYLFSFEYIVVRQMNYNVHHYYNNWFLFFFFLNLFQSICVFKGFILSDENIKAYCPPAYVGIYT